MIITVEGATLAALNSFIRFIGGKNNRIIDNEGSPNKIPIARLISAIEVPTRIGYQITLEVRESYDAKPDDPDGNTRQVPGQYLLRTLNALGLFPD